MSQSSSNIQQLIELLRPNTVILTPNQRLSRRLSHALDAAYRSQHRAWHTPSILPLHTWLMQLIDTQRMQGELPLKPLAQPLEELDAWQAIIEQDEAVNLRPKALAKLAHSAYRTIVEWRLDIEQHSFEFNADEDSKHFLNWCRIYKRQQASLPFISPIDAQALLAQLPTALAGDTTLILVGFQSIAPLHQHIINNAAHHEHFVWQAADSTHEVFAADDEQHELRAMAQWAFEQVNAAPDKVIAVCVPDLNQRKAQVLAALDTVFQPHAVLPQHERSEQFFDISAGTPLAETPLAKTLLDCLAAMRHELPMSTWQQLVSSPFTADTAASDSIWAQLHAVPIPQVKLSQLAVWLGADSHLEPLYQHSKTLHSPRSLGEWAQEFIAISQLWQWAANRTLSSNEYQQQQQCLQALMQFGRLRLKTTRLSFSKALELFTELLSQQIFHVQTPATQIAVLGSLETAGQVFDKLWVCGMQDNLWPPKLAPNPFIPNGLQHSLGMPRGSSQREFEYAQQLLNGFASSATALVFSYTRRADDVAVNLTRLLKLPNAAPYTPATPPNLAPTPPQFETVIDAPVAVADDELQLSSTTLVTQSQCPFKAFAARRLGLAALPQRSDGLSAAERGSLLHRALEAFYQQFPSSAAIRAASADTLQQGYNAAAQLAINSLAAKKRRLFKPALLELEQWRLQALIAQWQEVDAYRSHDFTVHALEYEHATTIAGLTINMRVDRIDAVNQQWFVIDYKSGSPVNNNWENERLVDPQLPLYAIALAANNAICGIAVAYVRPNESQLKALATAAAGIDTPKPRTDDNFNTIMHQWRDQLETLAAAYASGDAAVDPINTTICKHCDYRSLCRIFDAEPARAS